MFGLNNLVYTFDDEKSQFPITPLIHRTLYKRGVAMSRTVWLSIFCFLLISNSFAQPASSRDAIRYGFTGGYADNFYKADFMNLPGCSTCSHPNFRNGRGDGLFAGAFFHFPINTSVGFDLTYMYADLSGSFYVDEINLTPIMQNGTVKLVSLVYRQTLKTTMYTVGIEPQLYYYFFDAFRFSAGIGLSVIMKGACLQTTTLTDKNYFFYV
jgi:hypothetical protein